MEERSLEFPKKPKGATAARLTVGKYKKAIVPLKDLDTLRGVKGTLQYGTINRGRIFRPLGLEFPWDGYSSSTNDDTRKGDGGTRKAAVPLKHK